MAGEHNCERSHYMKTAGRKCFATAENLQVQSDHQTVTLHLAWTLRSVDGYLPYRQGWIRCHTFVCCSLSHFFFHFSSSEKPNTLLNLFILSSSRLPLSLISFLSDLSNLTSSCFCLSYTFPFKLSHSSPLSPSFSFCLWSVTLNLAPSICFSSFV